MRASSVLGEGGWGAQARRLAGAPAPAAVSPAAPRETMAVLDAWGPSLMPRSARARGVARGLGILGRRATSGVAEKLTRMAARADAPLPRQLVAWAVIGGVGAALAAVPERHSRKLWVASLQSTGLLLRDGAAGGAVHDLGRWLEGRYPDQRGVRPLTGGAVHTAGLLYRTGRRVAPRGRGGGAAARGGHGRGTAARRPSRRRWPRRWPRPMWSPPSGWDWPAASSGPAGPWSPTWGRARPSGHWPG